MSGYNFSYKLLKKYIVDVYEYYQDTNFTRAFIYKKKGFCKELIEIKDFPSDTDTGDIIRTCEGFIEELERIIAPLETTKTNSHLFHGKDKKTSSKDISSTE